LEVTFSLEMDFSDSKNHWTQERMPEKIRSPGFSIGEDIKIVPTLKTNMNLPTDSAEEPYL